MRLSSDTLGKLSGNLQEALRDLLGNSQEAFKKLSGESQLALRKTLGDSQEALRRLFETISLPLPSDQPSMQKVMPLLTKMHKIY